jgi:hypothetical protein
MAAYLILRTSYEICVLCSYYAFQGKACHIETYLRHPLDSRRPPLVVVTMAQSYQAVGFAPKQLQAYAVRDTTHKRLVSPLHSPEPTAVYIS